MVEMNSKNDLALWAEGTVKPATDFTPLDVSPNSTSVVELFERQVERTPDRVALKAQDTVVTYASLNRQANRVAHALRGRRKSSNPFVPLVMEHRPEKVAAAIGVLKAGLGYARFDDSAAGSAVQDLLRHIGAPLVIADRESLARSGRLSDAEHEVVLIDDILQAGSEENPNIELSPEAIADMSYTSGSTGRPKGVVRTMAHEMNIVQSLFNITKAGPEDVFAYLQTFWFSALFQPLICGATASFFDLRREKLSSMKRWLREERITQYQGMVTGFSQLLNALDSNDFFPDMRVVQLIGEPIHVTSLEKFRSAFPEDCALINSYGSNEQALISRFIVAPDSCPQHAVALPVGFVADGIEVELLDGILRSVPEGEVGEIAVSSPFLSSGYWREPDLTAETWVRRGDSGERIYLTGDLGRRDASGCLHVLGRKDDQIKIRGYRFLSSEAESVLNGLPGVRQAAVVPFGGGVSDEKLACYYVSQSGEPLDTARLRASLTDLLPSYMIPNVFLLRQDLPLTESGKLKRRALPRPDLQEVRSCKLGASSPRSDLEARLLVLWKRVLNTDRVGLTDNFFDLGGDSLAQITLIYEMERELGVELDLGLLLTYPTISDLIGQIDAGQISPRSRVVPLQEKGEKPPLYCLLGIHLYQGFADALGVDQPVFGVYVPQERQVLKALSEGDPIDDTVERLSDAYVQAIAAHQTISPCRIAGYSFGGILAIETAIKLRSMGHEVDVVLMLDTLKGDTASRNWRTRAVKRFLQGKWGLLIERAKLKAAREMATRKALALSKTNGADAGELRRILFERVSMNYFGPKELFDGTVALLRTSQEHRIAQGVAVKSDYGWGPYFNDDFSVQIVPGDHWTMLAYPHVLDVAKLVREHL